MSSSVGILGAEPSSRTASMNGMSQPLVPDTNLSALELVAKCVQDGRKIETQYDVWLPSEDTPDPTSDDMFTVFNNTIYQYQINIYPPALGLAENRNKDLYVEPLESFELSCVNPTTTIRLDAVYTIRLQSARDAGGRILGPFTTDAAEVKVFNGRGVFRIHQVTESGYAIVAEDQAPSDPEANTVVIRSNLQGVIFNIGVYKNNKLFDDFIFDPLGKKLEFCIPNCYLMKVYVWYHRNKSYLECTKKEITTGQIAFIELNSQNKPCIVLHTNRHLIAIPSAQTLQKVSQAYNEDEDLAG